MPLDCSDCALKNQSQGNVMLCQQPGTVFLPDGRNPNEGMQQIPLLHLIYELTVDAYKPEGRDVRATWLAKKFSERTGKELTPRKVKVSEEKARTEAREMVGMLLAQRSHFLPVWAQLPRAGQIAVAESIGRLLRGLPADEALPTGLQLELFRGSVHLRLEEQARQLQTKVETVERRIQVLAHELETVDARVAKAQEEIDRVDAALAEILGKQGAITRLGEDLSQHRRQQRQQLGDLVDGNGEPLTGMALEFGLDMGTNSQGEREQALALLQAYRDSGAGIAQYIRVLEELDGGAQGFRAHRDSIAGLLAMGDKLYEDFERTCFQYELLRGETLGVSEFAQATREGRLDVQKGVQMEALQVDYGLQPRNYAMRQECIELRTILQSNNVARQLYLFMHPLLKYTSDPALRCKIHKFLASNEVQQAFLALDETNLVHPGSFAKLGVFVINALVPGSYDDRHREMVQSELGGIQAAMVEMGMDPVVRCHSCGTDAPSGRSPDERRTDWIRDHNPPTSLYEMRRVLYYDKLGIPDHEGNGQAHGQMLLPQCHECSKRQGALTSKVVKRIKAIPRQQLLAPQFDLRATLQEELGNDDWADFERVALQPAGGWRRPVDYSGDLAQVQFGKLVTTGGAGSFAGIDDTLFTELGRQFGCHTCTDVDRQTDSFRNILWIADHQPPTCMVARGLMELPQIVYPHCWKCSETQSQLTRAISRLFDDCFTKEFKEGFCDQIRDRAWGALLA